MSKIIGVTVGTPQKPSDFANSLKGSASGNPIALPDVSPLPHEIKVKLKPEEGFAGERIYTDQYEFFSGDGIYVPSNKWYDENDGWCYEFEDGSYLYNAGYDLDKIVVKDGKPYRTLDVNGAVVQRYGLNLFDQETFLDKATDKNPSNVTVKSFVKQEDGSWLANNFHGSVNLSIPYKNKKHKLFVRATVKSTGEHTSSPFIVRAIYTDKTNPAILTLHNTQKEWVTLSGFTNPEKEISNILFTHGGDVKTQQSYYIKDIIFSYADAPYEPYTGEQETLTATDGNLSILGNGESMTLIGEEGVTMEAEYNVDTKKYIDKKFAELQALVLEV